MADRPSGHAALQQSKLLKAMLKASKSDRKDDLMDICKEIVLRHKQDLGCILGFFAHLKDKNLTAESHEDVIWQDFWNLASKASKRAGKPEYEETRRYEKLVYAGLRWGFDVLEYYSLWNNGQSIAALIGACAEKCGDWKTAVRHINLYRLLRHRHARATNSRSSGILIFSDVNPFDCYNLGKVGWRQIGEMADILKPESRGQIEVYGMIISNDGAEVRALQGLIEEWFKGRDVPSSEFDGNATSHPSGGPLGILKVQRDDYGQLIIVQIAQGPARSPPSNIGVVQGRSADLVSAEAPSNVAAFEPTPHNPSSTSSAIDARANNNTCREEDSSVLPAVSATHEQARWIEQTATAVHSPAALSGNQWPPTPVASSPENGCPAEQAPLPWTPSGTDAIPPDSISLNLFMSPRTNPTFSPFISSPPLIPLSPVRGDGWDLSSPSAFSEGSSDSDSGDRSPLRKWSKRRRLFDRTNATIDATSAPVDVAEASFYDLHRSFEQPSALRLAFSRWLPADVAHARVVSSERCGLTPEEADVVEFQSQSAFELMSKGARFTKPIKVSEDFGDAPIYDSAQFVQTLLDGRSGTTVVARNIDRDHDDTCTMAEMVKYMQDAAPGWHAPNVGPVHKAFPPAWTLLSRYQALDVAAFKGFERAGRPFNYNTSAISRSMSFSHLGTAGAFSEPSISYLGGTWFRILVGRVVLLFISPDSLAPEEAAFAEQGIDWDPRGKQRALVLNAGDVLCLPTGYLYALAGQTPFVILVGRFWDEADILGSVECLCETAESRKSLQLPRDLPLAIDGLRSWVFDNPGRFSNPCADGDPVTPFLREFQRKTDRLFSLGCACAGDCEPYCECRLSDRPCVVWCRKNTDSLNLNPARRGNENVQRPTVIDNDVISWLEI